MPRALRIGNGIAIAVFAGVVDIDGHAREPLDHVFAGEAACQLVPQAAMLMLGGASEFVVADLHFAEEDSAGSSETRPRVVSRTARGCSQISLSMKCL